MISTVDPQARHAHKTSAQRRDGYKAHIAAEPETGLVTECALTAAAAPDGPTGVGLLAGEEPGLEVLGDSAYGGRPTRAALRPAGDTQTIKPIPAPGRGAGRVHHPRLPHRPPGWHGPLPGGRHRADQQLRPGAASPITARLACCAGAAPPPSVAARSTCTPTRTTARRSPPRDYPQLPAQATSAGERSSNAGSPGWSPTAADGCTTTASTATRCVRRCESPRYQPAPAAGTWPELAKQQAWALA